MQKTKTTIIGTIIGELVFIAILGVVFYVSFPFIRTYAVSSESKIGIFVVIFCLATPTLICLGASMDRIIFRAKILLRKTNPLMDK
jgi:hypothetical protein